MATETAETRRGTRIYHERRSDERHTTIMRFAALRTFAGHHLCIVRDLTSKGAKLQTYGKLQPGASVYLDMQPDEPVAGEVVWSSGEHAGVRFHTKMDVLRTSAIGDSGRRRQVPRFELECSGLVRTSAQSLHVRLRNITLAGAAISNVEGLKMSTPISLSMPDMPPLEAVVSWTDGDVAGLTFKKRLPVDTLAVWIEQHQSLLATGSSYNRRSEV